MFDQGMSPHHSGQEDGRRARTLGALVAGLITGSSVLVGALPQPPAASAAIDDTRCIVEPSTSSGTQSGVAAVATGEPVRLGTEVDLEPGAVYQDILANPDGSTYVASWIAVQPELGTPAAADFAFTIDGVLQPVLFGTEPQPGGFVLDTSQPLVRLYFPGDPAVLADPTGQGQVSFTVPAGGSTLRLSYVATVPSGVVPGDVVDAVGCQAAVSYGEANAAVDERQASVAVLGLDVEVDKSADLPVLAPSTVVTYSIDLSVPAYDDSGEVRNGTAYDTVVSDVLPAGLTYVAGSASNGGTESGGVITWNIAELAAGSSVTLTYQMTVPANAAPGTIYTNDAGASTTSQPGAVAGEATRDADGDSVTLMIGAAPPGIDKSANVAVAGTNQLITYTVVLTWPAGSTWHDVTVTDLLPDGITLVDGETGFTCALTPPGCPAKTTLMANTDTSGNTRFGFFVPQVGPFAAPQTWTWTYTGRMTGVHASGDAVPLGTALDNLAEVRFNLIPRLGDVTPNLSHLNKYDGTVGDVAPVTFNRPVIAIDKTGPASPLSLTPTGPTYTVTLTNTGGVNATNVTFTDSGPLTASRRLGTIDAASVTGANYSGGVFTVTTVPANGTATVTYRVIGTANDSVADDDPYTNTATVTGYRDPASNVYTVSLPDTAQVTVTQPALTLAKERLSPSPIAGTSGQTISYRLTLSNTSAAIAYNVAGNDTFTFAGTRSAGTCTGGMTLNAAGAIAIAQLAGGATASCDYTVTLTGNQPEGDLVNTASVAWKNGLGQSGTWDDENGVVVPWTATSSASTTVVHPQLALQKTPDADTPGNTIQNGETSNYTITLTNTGPVPAGNVVLTDQLPAGLTLDGPPTFTVLSPSGGTIAHTTTGAAGASQFEIDIPSFAAGASVLVTVPVRHNGIAPADDQLVNTATVTADGVAAPLSDTGVLQWLPKINPPTATKTVDPASAGIGETITWTVTATVPENIVDVYDVAVVDTLPRGMTFAGYGTVTCVSGPLCPSVPSPAPLTAAVLPTGETRLGWFVGDVAASAGSGATSYTFTFTAQVAATYSGTGTPPAGTTVTDTDLPNRVQPWFTLDSSLDRYEGASSPDLGAPNLVTQFERRGAPSTTSVHVVTPRVVPGKVVVNRGAAFKWDHNGASGTGWTASAGDQITYEVTFRNFGGATAYDVVATDSAGMTVSGQTMLRDVSVTGLPPGVTVTDDWTLADPDLVFHIDQLDPGQSVTITYTGTVAPSSELVPGFSGDNRDIALIENTLTLDTFRSAPAGGGLLFLSGVTSRAPVYIYTPSPWIPSAAACVGSATAAAGTTATFSLTARNGAPPAGLLVGTLLTTGYPPNPTVGVGEDATVTVVLSPSVRYVPGTAKAGTMTISDPTSSIAGDVQTLVFALGDMAQNQSVNLSFGVRTIAAGVSGGMTATLTMNDASGSPSRGTAVAGAEYVYQHAQSRGCAPVVPLTIRKFPDQTTQYTGKKLFKVGESVTWTGDVFGGGAPYHDGEILDTMPDGIDYTPGTAVFNVVVTPGGPAVVASAANGNLTEVVTPLPDGRTQLRFTSPVFAQFQSMTYSMQSVVAGDAIVGSTLTNVINLHISDGAGSGCVDTQAAVCDNGQVRIISSADPVVSKSVDRANGPWGSTFTYTVDVTLPANIPYFDAFIADRGNYPRSFDGTAAAALYAGATLQCLSGCAPSDPAPSMLPVYRETGATADEFSGAWYLGDLVAQPTDRVYRLTYQQTFKDTTEYQAEFSAPAATQTKVNTAVTGWNDTNLLTDANYQPGGSAYSLFWTQTLATGPNRGSDDAQVTLIRPDLTVDKTCHALDGTDNAATSTSTGGETTGSVPNFRCVLTAKNPLDPSTGVTVVDPVFTDTLPATSNPGSRPVTWQVISTTPSDLLLTVASTATSITMTGTGIELSPGESVSVTVDLKMTASNAFWTDNSLTTELALNSLKATSFKDAQGNSYAGTSTDTWTLGIAKPKVMVSERGFGPDFYDASLADPTACLAYSPRTHDPPLTNDRVATTGQQPLFVNMCANLLHARLSPLTPGGEYARAYGGYGYGAPDVVPGVTDRLTWTLDVSVQSPGAFPTVSVTDQIPYGFEYVPGSARLAHWSESGTTHTALADPTIGANPAFTCNWVRNYANAPFNNPLFSTFIAGMWYYGHEPWTPLTWTFAKGAAGAAGAFWSDPLSYLNSTNRDAAGATTAFDRMVRVVFDIRPRAEFAACLETPQVANTFRSRAVATGTHARGTSTSTSQGWVVGADLAHIDKTPDNGISPDGSTPSYGLDVTITDSTRVETGTANNIASAVFSGPGQCPGGSEFVATPPKPALPSTTPWVGLGEIGRNGPSSLAVYGATPFAAGTFRSELVVTDTIVDDGQYVPGSATFDMRDPWGRPFVGHLASEEITPLTVGGRQAKQITWTFDYYPAPLGVGNLTATFPCATTKSTYVTYPSTMHISVPLPIADGTPDGTQYPNTAEVTTNHYVNGSLVRAQSDVDDALITARNPLPPPPTTKVAVPDQVAPGATFDWVITAELQANGVWFDLGWTDTIPANMELIGYGIPTCVLSGTATPCSAPTVTPTTLTPVHNGDGSTTVGWFTGDLGGSASARTLRMPVRVRFVGPEVAGDQLTNVVTGFSNEADTVGTITGPADPATFAYPGAPVTGTATVVEPNLTITKTVTNGPGPFVAGAPVTYNVTITNNGGATAYDVPVSDVPDATLISLTSASPFRSKGWTALDPRLEWFIPTIAPGASVQLDVAGVVAAAYIDQGIVELTNTVTIPRYTSRPAADTHGRTYEAVEAAATVPLVAPNLTVNKYAGAGCTTAAQLFEPGTPVDWCVDLANTGTAPSYNVTLTDLLPPGWTYEAGSAEVDGVATEPAIGTAPGGGQRLAWTLGDMAPATNHRITYRTIGPDGDTTVTNTAIADSTLEDGTPLPNGPKGFRAQGQAFAAAVGAGLQLAKLPDQQDVDCDQLTGCSVTWQLVVVNAGGLDLSGATLVDYLPAGLAYESSVTAPSWNDAIVGAAGSGPSGTTPVTWTNPGTFADGAVATFELTAHIPAAAQPSYLNHAVASATGVPDVENQAVVDVHLPELQIVKSSTATASSRPGDEVTYTITAKNVGEAPYTAASPAQVVDDLSSVLDDATYLGGATADRAPNTPSYSAPQLAWAGALAVGDTVTITYSVTVRGGGDGVVRNVAFQPSCNLSGPGCTPTPPPSCVNGIDPATGLACDDELFELPKLTIVKRADRTDLPAAGQDVTYTVTVTNVGPGDYTASAPAAFTDDLTGVLDDATMDESSISATVGDADFDSPELTWSGVLLAGQSADITYSLTYTGAGDQRLVNLACLPAAEAQDLADPCRTVQIPGSGLQQRKSADPPAGTALDTGDVVTYTLYFENVGDAGATVNSLDDLSGVLDDAVLDAGSISAQSGLAAVPEGQGIRITGTVPANTTLTVTYTVTVEAYPDQVDHVLRNVLGCPTGSPAGCLPATTEHPIRHLSLTKMSEPTTGVDTGTQVTYTLVVTNDGTGDYTASEPGAISDDLTDVLDDAVYNDDESATAGTVSYSAPILSWSGALVAGASATITYTVAVSNLGDHDLENTAEVTGCDDATCHPEPVITQLPHVVPAKASNPPSGAALQAGDAVTYTLTWVNDGQAAGVVDATDDLTDILDDADVTGEPVADDPAVSVSRTGSQIGIVGPIAAGDTITVTYQVTVKPEGQQGNHVARNVLTPDTPQVTCTLPMPIAAIFALAFGDDCPPVAPPTTEHPIGELVDWKTVDPASGTSVQAGRTLTYTLHFANVGEANVDVNRDDVLSGVLDDATLTSGPTASDPALTVSPVGNGRFTITGSLAPDQEATVTYTVTVNADGARGDDALGNFLVDAGANPPTGCVPTDPQRPDCTNNPVTAVTVVKSSNPAPGTNVQPGGSITYTLAFTNSSAAGPTPVDHTDHLGDVLDDATLTGGPSSSAPALSASFDGSVIHVTGQLAASQAVTITYTVTLKPYDQQGNHQLLNIVARTGDQPICAPGSEMCTNHLVAGAVPPPPASPTTTVPDPGELPRTGGNSTTPLWLGAVLLVVGVLLASVRRRRRIAVSERNA